MVCSTINYKKHLREYLDKYPLKSSKYLDSKDWCQIIDQSNNKNQIKEDQIKKCQKIKNEMNKNRTYFNWNHQK